jgi:hypothetical protein
MGMIGVDKIGEIRRAYFEQDRSIKERRRARRCATLLRGGIRRFEQVPTHVRGHSRVMASESEPLTPEEFASLYANRRPSSPPNIVSG